MTKTLRDNQVTERLRTWIEENFGDRGKFTLLETASSIPAQRWKNVFYQRQFATPEMLQFVQKMSTNSYQWVTTGVQVPRPDDYPFLAKPPTSDEQKTLAGRLTWAIKEWASPRGAALFQYLESRSNGKVSADQWAATLLNGASPTEDMIEVVCTARPHFTVWIVIGHDSAQVDPADEASITKWEHLQTTLFDSLAATFKKREVP